MITPKDEARVVGTLYDEKAGQLLVVLACPYCTNYEVDAPNSDGYYCEECHEYLRRPPM